MKILLLGGNGQVGWELQRALAPLGPLTVCDQDSVDFSDLEKLRSYVRAAKADLIANAAAYTAVDKAESEPDKALRINAEAVGVLAGEAKRKNAWLVHYSTDYIFDGTKSGAYVEDDKPNPINVYGATKLKGEDAVRDSGCKHLLFRTSWVYAARGQNFPKTMLRLARERDELKVVSDQIGAPTSAELIADITAQSIPHAMMDEDLCGTYHLVAGGETNWHAFAQFVLREAIARGHKLKAGPDNVKPISSAEYPSPAKRLANSRLSTDKLKSAFGLTLPPWEYHAVRAMAEMPPG